jgi:phosphate/sulfate permease
MEADKIPQPTAAAAAAPEGGILASISNAISGPAAPAAATAAATAPAATDGTTTTATQATAATASAINSVKDSFAAMTSGGSDSIFYLIVIVFLVAAIIAYFLYYFITDNILYQQKLDVEGTEVPIICNELSEFKITRVLPNSNGIKRTYGFWIYINDINKYAGKFRHIAHLGENAAHIKDGCPYIFLDNRTNSVHVRFAPKKEPKSMTEFDTLNEIPDIDTLLTYDGKRCGITIQYVPVQRWVHIVIVVSDFNGGIVYTYIDGELADVDNARERKLVLHELNFENKVGSLFVGGSVSNTTVNATGFSGLLSKFSIYNYDLNKNDIYKEYSRGPLNGLLTSLGIVSYGLRNPVYKLNAVY